jgi:hypothetical protein
VARRLKGAAQIAPGPLAYHVGIVGRRAQADRQYEGSGSGWSPRRNTRGAPERLLEGDRRSSQVRMMNDPILGDRTLAARSSCWLPPTHLHATVPQSPCCIQE